MRRDVFIELVSRQVHAGFASDDTETTNNLINTFVEPAIGIAAQANYKNNIAIDGISYVNNSFYTIYKSLAITADEQFLWKIELPDMPVGIGNMEGISTVNIKDNSSPQVSYPVILMSQNQRSFHRGMRSIPNKLLGYPQGKNVFIESTLILNGYTAQVTMVSGGDKTDLDSELNVPPDFLPIMIDWITKQLLTQRMTPEDVANDGSDAVNIV